MFRLFSLFLFFLSTLQAIEIKDYPILNEERLALTELYSERHYGYKTYHLIQPKMIVIHYTAQHSLRAGFMLFGPSTIEMDRPKLPRFGDLNVGAHYIVDQDGSIYSLLPTTVMGRHVIGFNHTAIGIENVGFNEVDLTEAQIKANVELIRFLTFRHPSIDYMLGHMEYMNQHLPHYKHRLFKDKTYEPSVKIDPGWSFLSQIRKGLKEKHKIVLKK